jgi:membrane protein
MPDMRTIVVCTAQSMIKDNLSALAAAVAFYAFLSIFPALTAVVSFYGLVSDPVTVKNQVAAMTGVLPPEATMLVAAWLQALIQGPPARFGIGLVVSVVFALWSAWSATGVLMTAVNICYGETESRSFIRFNLEALILSSGLAAFGISAVALVGAVPAALDLLPIPASWHHVIALVRWPLLTGLVFLALAIVYRYAPARAYAHWHFVSGGAVVATVLWIAGSLVFATYVSTVGSYDKIYGSLSAVIILLLWFYLTAYVILVGAELNAELERHARKPTHYLRP